MHFANDVLAILFVSLPDPASGLALSTYPLTTDDAGLLSLIRIGLAMIGVGWLTCRAVLRM
ncbi:hypothetical protein [Rhodovulum imhoffii]|uniref:hypothetical protein n=1 Tax=Rhodovulum imhoffii TaxID=365340 RepID=UPI001FD0D55C|nr:hypothetical protein [Rhodovulum imhoffii]